jgi:hypothetical protein
VRLVRLGEEPTKAGADVKAALATFGVGGSALGGVTLLGCTPSGSARTLDAVVVLPRGVLVVVGVDLPKPTLRLDASLSAQWRIDDMALQGGDGAINPAADAHRRAWAVAHQLQAIGAEPLPVSTVIAVGPYVGQVVQPTADLHRGVRVLHPTPTTLLSAARELATCERPCSADQAGRIITVLSHNAALRPAELIAEGFTDQAAADLARASTTLISRITDNPRPASTPYRPATAAPARHHAGRAHPTRKRRIQPRWLAVGAAGMVAGVMLAGIIVAIASAGDGRSTTKAVNPAITGAQTRSVDGVPFATMGSADDTDCTAHSYGDVHLWLSRWPCDGLSRRVLAVNAAPYDAAVAIAAVDLPDAAAAQEFQRVVDTPGGGGITTLVQDGQNWSGGPKSFDGAAAASVCEGTRVLIARVVWTRRRSRPDDPKLLVLAQQALRLPAAG